MSKVPYLPKTNKYISTLLKAGDIERVGHHNSVAEQLVMKFNPCFDSQTEEQRVQSDYHVLSHLEYLDREIKFGDLMENLKSQVENLLKKNQPFLQKAEDCIVNSDLSAGTLDEDLELELLVNWSGSEVPIYLDRDYALKLCAHLCFQFMLKPVELEKAKAELTVAANKVAEGERMLAALSQVLGPSSSK